MNGKEFTAKAKRLGAKVKKVDSSYWNRVWWEATFDLDVSSIEIFFEENKSVDHVNVLGRNDHHVGITEIEESIRTYQDIVNFVKEINANF